MMKFRGSWAKPPRRARHLPEPVHQNEMKIFSLFVTKSTAE